MTYYIRVRSYYPPVRFVGPFDKREDAEAEIIRFCVEGHSRNQAMRNLRNVPYIYDILTQTTARKIGLRDWVFGDPTSNLIARLIVV